MDSTQMEFSEKQGWNSKAMGEAKSCGQKETSIGLRQKAQECGDPKGWLWWLEKNNQRYHVYALL